MKTFLYLFLLFYVLYSLSFAVKFSKTNIFYSKKQRFVHHIMIWLVPFIWILILKTVGQPVPNRYGYNDQVEPSIDGGNGDSWLLSFYTFFHGSGYSSYDGYSGYGSDGYDDHGGHDHGGGWDAGGDGGD